METPSIDKRAGRVTVAEGGDSSPFDWKQVTGDLMKIRFSEETPINSAVGINYRGYWFYIKDDDLNSKSTFSLLFQVFDLQAGGAKASGPLLTLPVGK
tara:strand:- start:2052 stop:2345 length:294 start_codon:yes stop_codon:yes gene_type:complete